MKIAFLSYDFPEYCIRHANEMAQSEEVLLLLPRNRAAEHEGLIDGRVRYAPFYRPRYRQPLRQLITLIRLLSRIRTFRPDVVHFQNGHMYFNLVLPLLRRFPLVITIHDARQHLGDHEALRTPQALMDFGFRRADQVIVHGASLIPVVERELGFRSDDIHLIPHVAIGERPVSRPTADDGRTILFFGRIWEYKGLEYLIRAEPAVTARFPNARFVIAGTGEDFDRYRRMMVNPDRFEVHNDWIGEDRRAEMFAAASVVVLPYLEASQSGVIPVAYAFGKPVIATRVGGLPDIVDHGTTGLLVAPRDAPGLADAILQLLEDDAGRRRMGLAGKHKLERECSPAAVARQTLAVYRRAIGLRRPKRRSLGADSTDRACLEPQEVR
ncbi:MAG: glycosyltransferase family 4 protein [Pirellulaceae bacterium]